MVRTDPVLNDGSIVYTPGAAQGRTAKRYEPIGAASAQTSSTATVTATRNYDAFGLPLSTSGTPQGSFGFAGGEGYQEDGDSGLKLLGHRYYDPSTGRFLTRDHAKDGRNWYAYVRNNPLASRDPSGLNWFEDQVNSAWQGIANWWSGRDAIDNNGNPVRVGGWPSWFNTPGNAITVSGTVHLKNEEDYDNYMKDPHWEDHEEGHIKAYCVSKVGLIGYFFAWLIGGVDEATTTDGGPSRKGPYGHDYNPYEYIAEEYAYNKDGVWQFGSNPYP